MMNPSSVYKGNAFKDGPEHRGWIVGRFMPHEDVRRSKDVEVKWGVHQRGDINMAAPHDETRTTFVLLVNGGFRLRVGATEHVLSSAGDYVMWGPGLSHSWYAEDDSQVITIRWPSL